MCSLSIPNLMVPQCSCLPRYARDTAWVVLLVPKAEHSTNVPRRFAYSAKARYHSHSAREQSRNQRHCPGESVPHL